MTIRIEIERDKRLYHLYISGASGYGKSTEMFWLARDDMKLGYGVAVLDPKGALADDLLNRLPEDRLDDVIYLDGQSPIPLNFLEWRTAAERDRMADDIMTMFERFSDSTAGDQWKSVLLWTVNTVLEARGTFMEIYDCAVNEKKRKDILKRVNNHAIKDYWRDEFPNLRKDAATPIATRMTKFLLRPTLKAMLGTTPEEFKRQRPGKTMLDISAIVESGKILIANLSRRKLGSDTANILGALLVGQIQQAIFRRDPHKRHTLKPFYLFVDEFQHFQTSAFNELMKESRGFGLGLTISNLHPGNGQLTPEMVDDIKGCVTNYILLHMDEDHARVFKGKLKSPYYEIKPEELESLPEFKAFFYNGREARKIDTFAPPPDPTPENLRNAEYVKNHTVDDYACNPAVPHDESTTPVATPNDAISSTDSKDGGGPNKATPVPTYKNQTKGAGTPR